MNVKALIPHNCFNPAGRKGLFFLLLSGLQCYLMSWFLFPCDITPERIPFAVSSCVTNWHLLLLSFFVCVWLRKYCPLTATAALPLIVLAIQEHIYHGKLLFTSAVFVTLWCSCAGLYNGTEENIQILVQP